MLLKKQFQDLKQHRDKHSEDKEEERVLNGSDRK